MLKLKGDMVFFANVADVARRNARNFATCASHPPSRYRHINQSGLRRPTLGVTGRPPAGNRGGRPETSSGRLPKALYFLSFVQYRERLVRQGFSACTRACVQPVFLHTNRYQST
ncbi:hypothetical protein BN2475_430011 [Paraburkholderia ribeironis]|uniref:Uncharacterized protein n=1 Tax=Paraburkholderia ribeironis TaxID=1247936 RepID=A0A1N7S7Z7_9BURK|nr:hypothetical protein BN2475_430011 [Paraburkholderia ribeironis]